MANDRVKYLFVKRKMSNVTLSTLGEEPKKPILNKAQCKCNKKIYKNKNEARVKRDSEIVNTTVDHEYDMLVKTLSLIVNTMKINRNKKRRKYKVYRYCKKEIINLLNSLNDESYVKDSSGVTKPHSTPIVKYNETYIDDYPKKSKSYSESQNKIRFNTDFIVNSCCKTCNVPECINPFINPMVQARVYQCQLNSQEENCCCSCNSDAMFEVMKSLYDCYKKKNCDNCDCILCGHLPCEDRKLVGGQKSGVDVGVTTTDSARKKKLDKAKAEGLLTPLEGKTSAQKEKILKGLAKAGLPLPDGKSPSEKKIIQKVRFDMGLPPEPQSDESKEKHAKALAAGIITPLEGKTPAQKEHALRRMAKAGIPMPDGRTPSEKALIGKVKATTSRKASKVLSGKFPSEKLRKAQAEGLLTPLDGKSPKKKEEILKGLAKLGMPLPEGKTPSEKKLIQKVRKDMGLPPEGKTQSEKRRLDKAHAAGIISPLEGKSADEKKKILKRMADAGVPLPDGRTPSEKALIDKIRDETAKTPVDKLQKAKAQGLLTPLTGKTPEQKENILKGLAKLGLPLPEGKTPSEKNIIRKVRDEMGYPAEPTSPSEKERLEKAHAAGIITPLEGKTPSQKEAILKKIIDAGVPLPEGRSPSEKALIAKVKKPELPKATTPSEKLKKAKAEGLLTSLDGKSPNQKEKILKGLAKAGLPLPEGKTPSEQKLTKKIRNEMGLPTDPKTSSEKQRIENAHAAGIITPLEGKTPAQKEAILRKLADAGVPLPEGRTASEKALIAKTKAEKAKAEGLLTPLEGKTPAQKEKILKGLANLGLPLPEGKTPSEKKLIETIKKDMLSPPKELVVPSEKLRRAKDEGLLTPLNGKSPEKKEKILRGLAKAGLPLPEGKTPSEKKIIEKIRNDMGLPEGKTSSERQKIAKAYAAGIITPLEGKTPAQKENILKRLADAGVPLPKGRTPSEKGIIDKIRGGKPTSTIKVPSERLRRAKDQGLLTPLDGKSPEQKEKILRGLAKAGLPLPEGKTPSEKKIVRKVRHDMGLPVEPKIPSEKKRLAKAYAAGIVSPLEGKTPAEKENVLRRLAEAGVLLPEGRTPSEKALIDRVRATTPKSLGQLSSGKLRKAKAEGLLTPLKGKSPDQRENILRGLAKLGLPLPEGNTPSEKNIIKKVRHDMGYPLDPRTTSEKQKLAKAHEAGIVQALEGKTAPEKEVILKNLMDAGVILPEGRTPSEKALIARLKASIPRKSMSVIPSDKIKKAKALGLLTPLEGKSPEHKEKILKGLVKMGLPLPEGKTPSDKKLIQKVRNEVGYPSEPRTSSERQRLAKAHAAGIVTPLEGKKPAEKEAILKKMAQRGVPLPEGRSPSEKALIERVKAETPRLSAKIPSDIMIKAKAQGLLTSLEGKPLQEQEKILRGLAKLGLPLPEGKTPSERKLIQKIRYDMGYPMDPQTLSQKQRLAKAHAAGIVAPLEGKTNTEKEAILKNLIDANVPLPEGRTQSEKALIAKLKGSAPSASVDKLPSEKIKKAKALGLLTPLEGKPLDRKEDILKGLAKLGLPLPEGKTASEKKLIKKVRNEMGYPLEPRTSSEKQKLVKAYAAGLITPLEGKKPAEKENILKKMAEMGVTLPEGRTPSEKDLISKIRKAKEARLLPKTSGTKIPSEKLRKAKAEGLLTPLDGKTAAQKDKILRGLAKAGLPLPEGKTQSEKKLIKKIRNELGLPPEATTPSEKHKMAKAHAAGIITPLEGKTSAEKEAILKKMADAGIPLPEGRTPTERAVIAKLKKVDLISPLDGKTPAEKEKVLKGLIDAHLPLPEGKTTSEKALIRKLKADAGIPPEGATPSEKEIIRKAKADGLLTPIKGKSLQQKEKIIKGLIDAGLPIPEGETSSEKALIKKFRTEAGLPPEPTLSEKIGKIKTRSKKVGGVDAEYEDILKTTKCDRSCGCDKKKIRFKHSYIKIRVTSPDISSFCPCPDECLPGVKGGVFIDNEGIKVTVGTAVGVPILSQSYRNRSYDSSEISDCTLNTFSKKLLASVNKNACKIMAHETNNYQDNEQILLSDKLEGSDSTETVSSTVSGAHLHRRYTASQVYTYPNYVVNNMLHDIVARRGDLSEPCLALDVLSNHSMSDLVDFTSSVGSILLMNSDSVTLSVRSSIADYGATTTSGVSVVAVTSNLSAKSSIHDVDNDIECEYLTKEIDYSAFRATVSSNNVIMDLSKSPSSSCTSKTDSLEYDTVNDDVIILRLSDKGKKRGFFKRNKKEIEKSDKNVEITKRSDPIVVINDMNTCPMTRDVMKMITEILAAKPVDDDSSVFVLVPSDDINNDYAPSMQNINSTVGLQISDDRPQIDDNTDPSLKPLCEVYKPKRSKIVPTSRGIKFCRKPKGEKSKDTFTNKIDDPCQDLNSEKELTQCIKHNQKDSSKDVDIYTSNECLTNSLQQINDHSYDNTANVKLTRKRCVDIISPKAASKLQVMFDDLGFERIHVSEPVQRPRRMIGVDTTADRPCCCRPCNNNDMDEEESESSLPVHYISHHGLVSRGGSSPVMSRPKTTDEGHQMFSSPFKSPDLSNSQIISLYPKVRKMKPLPDQTCRCPPKTKYSDSQNLFNQSIVCTSKYNLSTDYVRQSFANNVEPFTKVTQEQLQNTYRGRTLYSDYLPGATNKSQDMRYRALSNLNTAYINSHVDTTKHGYNSSSNKQLGVVKISLRNPKKICPLTCKHNENDPNIAKGVSITQEDIQNFKGLNQMPGRCNAGDYSQMPKPALKNPNVICPTTCRHILDFKQGAIPGKCNQGVGNHDEIKQTPCPENKIDKLRELKKISLKNPNRICPPTCRHVIENTDPNSPVHKSKTTPCPPTCSHVQNPAAACDKQEPESATERTPRRICPPTCSRAERLSFEELQTRARQPDNLPFRLVPVPLSEGQTTDTDRLNGVSRHHVCAPRCGKPPSLEKLECEQKQLQMRKRLRETMGDAWPEPETSGAAVLVIGNENIDNQIECTCGSKQTKKSKNEKDCECNTRQKIKRKKKCLCGDFIPPPPKIAPDLPPLPRAPSAESTQTESFSLFKKSSSGSINLRDEIMLQTEQTQAVSGFKVSNRGNVTKDYSYKEGDLFYDDALVYFDGDIPPEIEVLFETGPWERPPGARTHTGGKSAFGMPLEGHDACSCEDRETFLKESMCPEEYEEMKKRHKCECPLKSELPPEEPGEPGDVTGAIGSGSGPPRSGSGMGGIKNGLKFAIGGKGTGSKGLSGICCFDLSIDDYNDTLTDDLSDNDYIIYTD